MVYWQCKDCGRKYQQTIAMRVEKFERGFVSCTYCSGRAQKKLIGFSSLPKRKEVCPILESYFSFFVNEARRKTGVLFIFPFFAHFRKLGSCMGFVDFVDFSVFSAKKIFWFPSIWFPSNNFFPQCRLTHPFLF